MFKCGSGKATGRPFRKQKNSEKALGILSHTSFRYTVLTESHVCYTFVNLLGNYSNRIDKVSFENMVLEEGENCMCT